jgi:hypothetical protein
VRGGGSEAQDVRLIIDVRVRCDLRFAVDHHDTVLEWHRGLRWRAATGADEPIDSAPEPLGGPLDGVRRGGDVLHQRIGVGEAHRRSDAVLILQ